MKKSLLLVGLMALALTACKVGEKPADKKPAEATPAAAPAAPAKDAAAPAAKDAAAPAAKDAATAAKDAAGAAKDAAGAAKRLPLLLLKTRQEIILASQKKPISGSAFLFPKTLAADDKVTFRSASSSRTLLPV